MLATGNTLRQRAEAATVAQEQTAADAAAEQQSLLAGEIDRIVSDGLQRFDAALLAAADAGFKKMILARFPGVQYVDASATAYHVLLTVPNHRNDVPTFKDRAYEQFDDPNKLLLPVMRRLEAFCEERGIRTEISPHFYHRDRNAVLWAHW